MLVLSRRGGEKIHIGDEVVVKLLEVKGTKVRLGITAPRDICIRREQCHERPPRSEGAAAKVPLKELLSEPDAYSHVAHDPQAAATVHRDLHEMSPIEKVEQP